MGAKTKIEWCDASWNPVTGCYHACEYCYARRMVNRFSAGWENASNKTLHTLNNPAIGMRCGKSQSIVEPYPYGFHPTFYRYRLDQLKKWVKPKTIFVCSMADLFGEWVPDSWIQEVFDTCNESPQHRYLFLTKNPKRYGELYRKDMMPAGEKSWNKWYGCSITKPDEDFYWIDEDAFGIDHYGFLSIEPLLSDFPTTAELPSCIRWVIIGAETGNRKDKVIPKKEWIDHICEVADKNGTAVFMKDSLIPIVGEENIRREFPWKER